MSKDIPSAFIAAAVSAAFALVTLAMADTDSRTWQFDETTTGNDIEWTSPTSVDPEADQYDGQYEILLVEVMVSWEGVPFGPFDVTDDLGDDATGGGVVDGPAPVVLLDDSIIFPEPPEPTTFAADLVIGLDADGFGYFSATNIILGTAEIDLGWPIGIVTVQIESVRIVGEVTVKPLYAPIPGDLNGDGVVDGADLAILLGAWGQCADPDNCPADLNGDGVVNGADLAILLGNWS